MKKIYFLFYILVCVTATFNSVQGQEPRYVEVAGYDLDNPEGSVGDYNNVLWDAIYNDTLGREENPNTIYLLKRNHVYPMGKIIKNNFPLNIQGEEGDGVLPEISVGLKTDGTTGNDFIDAYNDLTVKNIYFNGSEGGGAYLHRMIEIRANNARYEIDGCAFSGDNSGAVVLKADSIKAYVRNSVMGNLGHRYVMNGNGRFIEIRGEAPFVDTLVIENCLAYNMTDRIIRNQGSVINYLKVDHLTAVNTVGRHGGVELGTVREGYVTNNVLANVISIGHTDSHTEEQEQPDGHFAAITLDSVFEGQVLEVRNNNIYWEQDLEDAWALYDSVEAPNYICSNVEAAIGSANVGAAYFDEPLEFGNVCGNISDYVANYYADPSNEDLPDSWCVGGSEEGGYYYDEFDVSYADTYDSYTADENGKPVGCQLHFDFSTAINSNTVNSDLTASFYPNPFETTTTLKYTLSSMSNVKVTIYDITGSEVQVLVNEYKNAGEYYVDFNADMLSSGLYFYKLDAETNSLTGKLVVK